MSQEVEAQFEGERSAASQALTGMLGRMVDDGVEPAVLVDALADALGAMMAAAPRQMADLLDAAIIMKIKAKRAATWAALDAEPVH